MRCGEERSKRERRGADGERKEKRREINGVRK